MLEFDWKKELGMDWHSLCPTKEEIEEEFSNARIETIEYIPNYPAVEVLITYKGSLQLWKWDRWHGGGFWVKEG